MKNVPLLLMSILFAGCVSDRPEPESAAQPCTNGTAQAGICRISPVELLLSPHTLQGRVVSVVLYHPGYGARMLFASRDAADANDLVSGFAFDEPTTANSAATARTPGFYSVTARFERAAPVVLEEGVAPPLVLGGRLAEVQSLTRITSIAEIVAECERREGCVMHYDRGLLPLPTLPP